MGKVQTKEAEKTKPYPIPYQWRHNRVLLDLRFEITRRGVADRVTKLLQLLERDRNNVGGLIFADGRNRDYVAVVVPGNKPVLIKEPRRWFPSETLLAQVALVFG